MPKTNCAADGNRFQVGRFYEVPCIKASASRYQAHFRNQWVPVMGPEHRDAEVIKFPYSHWHVDWRFAGTRMFSSARRRPLSTQDDSNVYNYVLQRYAAFDKKDDLRNPFVVTGDVVMRRMQCKREFPAYPHSRATWLRKLEGVCEGLRMTNMVCPHRGMPLESCPQDGDVVQCPGHGLRWNVKTGELVRDKRSPATPLSTKEKS